MNIFVAKTSVDFMTVTRSHQLFHQGSKAEKKVIRTLVKIPKSWPLESVKFSEIPLPISRHKKNKLNSYPYFKILILRNISNE